MVSESSPPQAASVPQEHDTPTVAAQQDEDQSTSQQDKNTPNFLIYFIQKVSIAL
jgi:hypothetical protein